METAYSLNIIADTNIVEKLVIKINFRNDFILFVNIRDDDQGGYH
jgi:hypothetical protein